MPYLAERVLAAGLAALFVVTGGQVLFAPREVGELAAAPAWMVPWVGVNDLVVGLLLGVSVAEPRIRPLAWLWAGTWLVVVSAVKIAV